MKNLTDFFFLVDVLYD